jgi:hypothetical protein
MIALVVVMIQYRPRGDPLPLLALAAFIPFALLHFPSHLAVGLIPMVIVLAHLAAAAPVTELEIGPWVRRSALIVVAVVMFAGLFWQARQTIINLWRGGLEYALGVAQSLDDPHRSRQAAMVEAQALPRISALPASRPWLWRIIGRARLTRGEDIGAETAFRTAMTLWPHEEAELGLGLALASQSRRIESSVSVLDANNRRGDAVMHLVRVCRTNPALIDLIGDPEIASLVDQIVHAFEEDPGSRNKRPGARSR